MGGRVGVEAFSIFAFSVSLSALEFVVSKFTWRFSKSFSIHRQIWTLVVFRVFRALPDPVDKFCLWIYAFEKISHIFGFGVADPPLGGSHRISTRREILNNFGSGDPPPRSVSDDLGGGQNRHHIRAQRTHTLASRAETPSLTKVKIFTEF